MALFVWNRKDFPDDEAMPAITGATIAGQKGHRFLIVTGEEMTPKCLVLCPRHAQSYRYIHYSNSRSSQSSTKIM